MTWLYPSGSCFLIGLVHTCVMPGYCEGSASAPLIAFSICAGVASAFHLMAITWITVFGLVSAANTPTAIIVAAAQAAKNSFLVISFSLVIGADGESRTPIGLPLLEPKSSASASSATSARGSLCGL